jgi:hypothetical protein
MPARTSAGALARLYAALLEEVQTAQGTRLRVLHEGEEDPAGGGPFVRFGLGVSWSKRQRAASGTDEPCTGAVTVSGILVVGTEQGKAAGIYTLIDMVNEKLDERFAKDADGNQLDLFRAAFAPPGLVPLSEERRLMVAEFEQMGTCQRSSGVTYPDLLTPSA